MQKYLIPAVGIGLFSGLYLSRLLFYSAPFTGTPPAITLNHSRVIIFLTTLFLFATSATSIILFYLYRLLGDYTDPRFTYRKSLRQGALAGLGIIIACLLLLTRTANFFTLLLTLAVTISLEYTLRN